jgi:enamine deaminase RidA (YjgF/YER057c/UK114 family)
MLRDKTPESAALSLSPSAFRRFHGARATELFVRVRPESVDLCDVGTQTESVYRQLRELLRLEGGGPEHVLRETVYFRNIDGDLGEFQRARDRVFDEAGQAESYRPAPIWIEQAPLEDSAAVEIQIWAMIPKAGEDVSSWIFRTATRSECAAEADVKVLIQGDQKHVHAGNILGPPGVSYDETLGMFESALGILEREGMGFRNVARTWIYLRNMDADYGEFNRARRDFFQRTGVVLHPASTGIDGRPLSPKHAFVLGFYAVQSARPVFMEAMTTPTLNEACDYGSDFSRGLRVEDSNKVALYVSGTASVDEDGRTAHVDDFEAQVERTFLNVKTLLERQHASLRDLVSATTYIKHAKDAAAFRRIVHKHGLNGFPNVVVEAGVCRPDLLCEIEAIAVLPQGSPRP